MNFSMMSRNEFLTPFDKLYDDVMRTAFPGFSKQFGIDFFGKGSYPKIDISNDGKQITIIASVPGLTKKELSVTWDADRSVLSIKGDKKEETGPPTTASPNYIVKELKTSSFIRRFLVKDNFFEMKKIKVSLSKGFLVIILPKKEPTPTKPSDEQTLPIMEP